MILQGKWWANNTHEIFGILWVFGGVGLLLGDRLKMQLYHLIEVQTDRQMQKWCCDCTCLEV